MPCGYSIAVCCYTIDELWEHLQRGLCPIFSPKIFTFYNLKHESNRGMIMNILLNDDYYIYIRRFLDKMQKQMPRYKS